MKDIYDWNNKNINIYFKSAKEPRNNNGDVIEIVGNNFKEIFGVEKSYLSFMQSIDIDYWELCLGKIFIAKK